VDATLDMDSLDGTSVLEALAAVDAVDAFFEAIDADDHARATALLRRAHVDRQTIAWVLRKMRASDGEH